MLRLTALAALAAPGASFVPQFTSRACASGASRSFQRAATSKSLRPTPFFQVLPAFLRDARDAERAAATTRKASSDNDSSSTECDDCACDMPKELFKTDADDVGRHDGKASQCKFDPDQERFHVHVGLGRLSAGLVLPGLATGKTRFAVIQRPSKDWAKLADKGKDAKDGDEPQLEVRVNGKDAAGPLRTVVSMDQLDAAIDSKASLLVLTDDKEAIAKLVKKATSFSCSLGSAVSKVLEPMLSKNLEEEECGDCRPVLYACENDFEPVRDLRSKIGSKVHVVETMVDRVCVDRGVDAEKFVLETTTEPYAGRMVTLEPLDPRIVPFGGEVIVPDDKTSAKCLYEHKFQTVNGAHGTLGFMSLQKEGIKKDQLDDVLEEGKLPLLKPLEAPDEFRDAFNAWQAVRGAFIVAKFGVPAIAKAMGIDNDEKKVFADLVKRQQHIEERLSSLDDTAPRTFEGDPVRMYMQRMAPIRDFVRELGAGDAAPAAARFLVEAMQTCTGADDEERCSIKTSREHVDALCQYAADLCGIDAAKGSDRKDVKDGKAPTKAQPKEPVSA